MNTEIMKNDWKKALSPHFERDSFKKLNIFLKDEVKDGVEVYPPKCEVFNAFQHTSLKKTKVIIIGQDPYHGEGQAHGLSFSVRNGVKVPPSLKNIYKEINDDLGINIPVHGDLTKWASQGVLLLNSVLTVEKSKAASHRKKGWEDFTDEVIQTLNDKKESLVFMLWGAPAQKKAKSVNSEKHLILISPHPSPLSSYRGFFGNKHFSKCNNYLIKNNITPVNWDNN